MTSPRRFGPYRVRQLLGTGSVARVYLCDDPASSRRVAVKVVQASPDLEADERERRLARFLREYRVTCDLDHPGIVRVHEIGEQDGETYIAMEHVDGPTLDALLLSEAPLAATRVGELARRLAAALDHAHSRGVVHRDLKPANVLVAADGQPKVADFGLAKIAATTVLTRTSSILGTPHYMSPEQVTGHEVSGASDQFSLAILVYRALTGERPFTGNTPTAIMYRIVHDAPPRPGMLRPELSADVDRTLLRALDKDPARRFPTCRDFARALAAALERGGAGRGTGRGAPRAEPGAAPDDTDREPGATGRIPARHGGSATEPVVVAPGSGLRRRLDVGREGRLGVGRRGPLGHLAALARRLRAWLGGGK